MAVPGLALIAVVRRRYGEGQSRTAWRGGHFGSPPVGLWLGYGSSTQSLSIITQRLRLTLVLSASRLRSRHGRNTETRHILLADIVGYSRLTGADKELTLAQLPTLRSDLIRTRKPKPSLPRI